jgi:hypothetical protein
VKNLLRAPIAASRARLLLAYLPDMSRRSLRGSLRPRWEQGAARDDFSQPLSLVHRAGRDRTGLVCLRASDLALQARRKLPCVIPVGFHGCWRRQTPRATGAAHLAARESPAGNKRAQSTHGFCGMVQQRVSVAHCAVYPYD